MPKKKKYFPNNWRLYKDSDDSMFIPHEYDEFMAWKVGGWEIPSSVCCIIRESDPVTKKVKEHVYSRPQSAARFVHKLMEEGKEFTICDEEQIHQMYPDD